MQDPSGGVPAPLLQHIHLLSNFRFAHTPVQLPPETALEFLLKGPQLFRDHPAAWSFFSTPKDGTLRLAWQPTQQLGNHYATDGIIWASPETGFIQDVRGYKIESYVCECGFVPPAEQVAARRRLRYRLISSPNNTPVDPSIELIHYLPSLPAHRIPIQRLQPPQQALKSLNERRFFESSGILKRQEFALHDRQNWPQMAMPNAQNMTNPYRPAAGAAAGQPSLDRAIMAGQAQTPLLSLPPARGNIGSWPGQGAQMGPGAFMADFLKDEEYHTYGDNLDFVTPRDLSAMRYKQHHEWMEEVLSSPLELSKIEPVNLALGAEGELAWLTDGLWDNAEGNAAPGEVDSTPKPTSNKYSVTSTSVREFEKRVEQYLRQEEKNMSKTTEEHADVLERMSQQQLFANLERRLAEASTDTELDKIIREAELATAAQIGRRQQALTVSKGGLLKSGEEKVATNDDEFEDDFSTNMDTAGEALDLFDNEMEFTSVDVTT